MVASNLHYRKGGRFVLFCCRDLRCSYESTRGNLACVWAFSENPPIYRFSNLLNLHMLSDYSSGSPADSLNPPMQCQEMIDLHGINFDWCHIAPHLENSHAVFVPSSTIPITEKHV